MQGNFACEDSLLFVGKSNFYPSLLNLVAEKFNLFKGGILWCVFGQGAEQHGKSHHLFLSL